jgi:hypothetical protein
MGHFPWPIACVLGVARLLVLSKPLNGIKPIAMGKVFYQLVNNTLCFQLHDVFSSHMSPRQFGMAARGKCEVVVHDIRVALDVHLDWVVLQVDVANTFNSILCKIIF